MDALDILKAEHERALSICRQLKAEKQPRDRATLLRNLHRELLGHLKVEETVFYPAFKDYPDFQDLLGVSNQNHRDVKEGLQKLESDPSVSLDPLLEALEKHVRSDEEEFFPKVRKLMKRSERDRMGRHLQAARSEAEAA